jgi:hypothetical protein
MGGSMSACLILQQKKRIFMGADSALSYIDVNRLSFRVSENQHKIFNIKNSLMFCSGDSSLVLNIVKFIENINCNKITKKEIDDIQIYLKNLSLVKHNEFFNIEIIICLSDTLIPRIFQLSEYNDFDIVEHFASDKLTKIITGGIKTKESADLLEKYYNTTNDVKEIFKNAFDELSYESIGGTLELWECSSEIRKIYEHPIKEKNIQYLQTHFIAADMVVGRLLAGNELIITNESSSFYVSGSHVSIIDADLSLYGEQIPTRILLDPNVGIEISKKNQTSGSYSPNFYVDTDGNIIFSGTLKGAVGDFTGAIYAPMGQIGAWTIDEFGLKDTFGNYIYGTGNVRLGKLTIEGSNATFDGNIYARNLQDLVQSHQIGSVNADVINAGTIRGINIYGCNIAWPGVLMHSPYPGLSRITADNGLNIASRNNVLDVGGIGDAINLITQQTNIVSDIIALQGSIVTTDSNYNQGWGVTRTLDVGTETLHFINGLLIDPYHYQSSGSGTSGSGGDIPPTSGSITFVSSDWYDDYTIHHENPVEASYEGNGIVQIQPILGQAMAFRFRLSYEGLSSQVGTVIMDWEHLSGDITSLTSSYHRFLINCALDLPVGGDPIHPFESWGKGIPVSFLTPSLYSWIGSSTHSTGTGDGGYMPLLSSGSIVDYFYQNDITKRIMPDLQSTEERWFIFEVWFGNVISTCRFQIKKIYIRPPLGDGSTDIIIWQKV